jgi:hypothetical protein
MHEDGPKGSGGVGILVKKWLYELYYVDIIDRPFEGILGVQFQNRHSDFSFVLFTLYLPLENSP